MTVLCIWVTVLSAFGDRHFMTSLWSHGDWFLSHLYLIAKWNISTLQWLHGDSLFMSRNFNVGSRRCTWSDDAFTLLVTIGLRCCYNALIIKCNNLIIMQRITIYFTHLISKRIKRRRTVNRNCKIHGHDDYR